MSGRQPDATRGERTGTREGARELGIRSVRLDSPLRRAFFLPAAGIQARAPACNLAYILGRFWLLRAVKSGGFPRRLLFPG
jgi:hypothetical protein